VCLCSPSTTTSRAIKVIKIIKTVKIVIITTMLLPILFISLALVAPSLAHFSVV